MTAKRKPAYKRPAVLPDRLSPDISETRFGKLIEQCADENGWEWSHVERLWVPTGSKGGKRMITPAAKGFPDYVIVHPRTPTLFVLEIKAKGGTVSPEQKRWLKRFGRVPGCQAFAAWPEDWPQIRRFLESAPPASVTPG